MSNNIETSVPLTLSQAIEYAEGSVVSRTVVRKSGGNVTLFAYDKGEGLAEHTTPHEAIVQVLDGVLEITIGGHPNTVQSGQLILLPANVAHSVKAIERAKMLLIMIKSE